LLLSPPGDKTQQDAGTSRRIFLLTDPSGPSYDIGVMTSVS